MFSADDFKLAFEALKTLAPVGRMLLGVATDVGIPVLTEAVRQLAGSADRFDRIERRLEVMEASSKTRMDALESSRVAHDAEQDARITKLEASVVAVHKRLDVMGAPARPPVDGLS